MRWLRYGGFGLALVAAGCGGDKTPSSTLPDNEPAQLAARLEGFTDCGGLERYIEDTAVKRMRSELETQKPAYWGRFRGGSFSPFMGGEMPPEAAPSSDSAGGGSGGSQGPNDHTGTNNQVEGVHEADFVQNDGTRIFVLSGNKLYLHRSWPAEQLTLAASLEVEGWPSEMLLEENNRLVIVSQVYEKLPGVTDPYAGRYGGGVAEPAVDCAGLGCGYAFGNTTKVTTVNVADVAHPQVVDQLYLPGAYTNARRVDASVRLVLTDSFRWPEGMRWWVDYDKELFEDEDRLTKLIDELIARNEKLIREQTLERWLPEGRRVSPTGETTKLQYACSDFYRSNAPSGLGFVTVASVDLDSHTAVPGRVSLVAAPGEVYASKDSLYLASNHWWWWPAPGQKDYTYIHKFDIRQPGQAAYVASGTVEGHLLDQFSMDEHEGVLRVATTISTRVPESENPDWWWRTETTNRVSTWRDEGGALVEVGRSEDLAPGERIFSARFMGPRGYVVTFRQVDPLYTFDLSDPAHPRKVGELKVPGFSTYLHPVGDHHLLAMGEYIPENGDWRARARKLSLFDVSDPANPVEAFTKVIGTTYGGSEASYEHKAFNYFPAKGLLAIPYTDYDPYQYDYWRGFRTEVRVFRVDTAAGFSDVGALSMTDMYVQYNDRSWTWYWTPQVRRSVMADDYVYAISDAGVRVAKVDSLQSPLVTTRFQRPTTP